MLHDRLSQILRGKSPQGYNEGMNTNNTEIETKYYVRDLQKIKLRLHELGAQLIQERVHERNLRFDDEDDNLRHDHCVLRLRHDTQSILTYKGPGIMQDGIRAREELEVTVSDFVIMQSILEALGYRVQMMYEKYRTTYLLGETHIMLDEMPYGNFVEIEGADNPAIFAVTEHLKLDKSANIPESYIILFERIRDKLGLYFNDLSFDNFASLTISPADMGIKQADK